MTYINAVKYILSLPDTPCDADSIERMRIICDTLDTPRKKLKSVHVCGDVGKDSCLTMIEAILKSTSHSFGRCSLHFSDDPRECISVNGKAISHFEFSEIIKNISKAYKSKFKDSIPNRSEVLTLSAIVCFLSNGCDISLFERSSLKAAPASIIEPPLVSLLTPFSERDISDGRFEHLIPKGTAETVSSPQHKEVFNAVSSACVLSGSRLTVPIYSDMEIKSITLFKTEFSYRGEVYSMRSFSPCQTVNAITAVEVANALTRCGFQIDTNAVKKGLFTACLDGKCEAISIEPTVIVSSLFKMEHVDALAASLAQVKEQFASNPTLLVDPGCGIGISDISAALSAHEISHETPSELSRDEIDEQLQKMSALDKSSVVLIVGGKSFIRDFKNLYRSKFGF